MGLPKKVLACLMVGVMCVMPVGCSNSSRRMGKRDVEGSYAQWTEEKERVPVHSWHKERVENIRRQKEWAGL